MTDGSSQGLFVVVAVVIFGIFVAISYSLFRDQLSPALASIFSDAIEQSHERTIQYTDERFFIIDSSGKITDYLDYNPSDEKELPKDVKIPQTINGITVTSIGPRAFMEKGITGVIIPKTVVKIDDGMSDYNGAFYGNSIKNLEIPGSVKHIGSFSFMKNPIDELTLNEGVEYISSHAFTHTNIQNIKLPNSVNYIGPYSFTGKKTKTVTLGEGLKTIRDFAFYGNDLKEVTIPKSVDSVGKMVFLENNNLTTINVSEKLFNHIKSAVPEFTIRRAIYNSSNKTFEGIEYFPENILKVY